MMITMAISNIKTLLEQRGVEEAIALYVIGEDRQILGEFHSKNLKNSRN
jgi:hypothetical protein